MECDISGSGGKVPVIVAATVATTGLVALVAGSLGQHRSLLLQQLIQRFFHAAPDQFFQLPLLQYIWTRKPGSQSGFLSISCLSYNKRSNWLTIHSLGFYVR